MSIVFFSVKMLSLMLGSRYVVTNKLRRTKKKSSLILNPTVKLMFGLEDSKSNDKPSKNEF